MSRWAQVATVALLAAAIGLSAVWLVRRMDGDAGHLLVTWTVEAIQVDVSPKVTGRIVELAVREDQRVERGQLLARRPRRSWPA